MSGDAGKNSLPCHHDGLMGSADLRVYREYLAVFPGLNADRAIASLVKKGLVEPGAATGIPADE